MRDLRFRIKAAIACSESGKLVGARGFPRTGKLYKLDSRGQWPLLAPATTKLCLKL